MGHKMPRTRHYSTPLANEVGRLEDLPVPVVAYGRDLEAGAVLPFHRHRRAQFVYASSGVMTVTTPSAAYVVPPQRAVWMPGGVMHQIDAQSVVCHGIWDSRRTATGTSKLRYFIGI